MVEPEERDLARGALVNGLGNVLKLSKAFYLIVLPRLFGAPLFGLSLLAIAVHEGLSKLTGLGLEWATLRIVVQKKARGEEARIRPVVASLLRRGILSSFGMAVVFFFLAPWIAETVFLKKELSGPLRFTCLVLPLLNAETILLFALRATRKMQYELAVKSIFEPLVLLAASLFAFRFARNIYGILGAYAVSIAFGTALAAWYFLREFPHDGPGEAETKWRGVFGYSLPMSAMDLMNTFKVKIDLMVVGRFLPLEFAGIFGAVVELANLIRKVRLAFEPVFMPIVAHLHELKDRIKLRQHFTVTVRWTLVVSMWILGPMTVAPELFLRPFGQEFAGGAGPLIIMAWGMLVYASFGMADAVLSMTGHPYANMMNSSGLIGLNLVLLIFLVPKWGLTGAAVASTISLTAVTVWRILQAWRYAGVQPFHVSQLKPLGASLLAVVLGLEVKNWLGPERITASLVGVVSFLLCFGFLLYVFRLETEDREVLEKGLSAIRRGLRRRSR